MLCECAEVESSLALIRCFVPPRFWSGLLAGFRLEFPVLMLNRCATTLILGLNRLSLFSTFST